MAADGVIINRTSDLMLTPSSTASLSYYGSESVASTPPSMASPGMSPCSSPSLSRWGTDIICLPSALERVIKVRKGSAQLGKHFDFQTSVLTWMNLGKVGINRKGFLKWLLAEDFVLRVPLPLLPRLPIQFVICYFFLLFLSLFHLGGTP